MYSDCCGAENLNLGGAMSSDFGICPCCKEHCTFIEEDNNAEEMDAGRKDTVKTVE